MSMAKWLHLDVHWWLAVDSSIHFKHEAGTSPWSNHGYYQHCSYCYRRWTTRRNFGSLGRVPFICHCILGWSECRCWHVFLFLWESFLFGVLTWWMHPQYPKYYGYGSSTEISSSARLHTWWLERSARANQIISKQLTGKGGKVEHPTWTHTHTHTHTTNIWWICVCIFLSGCEFGCMQVFVYICTLWCNSKRDFPASGTTKSCTWLSIVGVIIPAISLIITILFYFAYNPLSILS